MKDKIFENSTNNFVYLTVLINVASYIKSVISLKIETSHNDQFSKKFQTYMY